MKRYRIIFSLAVAAFMVTACEDEQIVNITPSRPAEIGEEIFFGARAGFENANPETRTAYGDIYTDETGTKYERIDWVEGMDMVEIYSPEVAGGPASHHYKIMDASVDENGAEIDRIDEGYLSKIKEEEPALAWGAGSDEKGTHSFYAMYPSLFMFSEKNEAGEMTGVYPSYAEHISMKGKTVNGYVHTDQLTTVNYTEDENKLKHYTASPDMRFAYMVAQSNATRESGNVNLTFYPIVTAVQIQLMMPTGNDIKGVNIGRIKVTSPGIAGSFSADLNGWEGTAALPTNKITLGDVAENSIYITTWADMGNGLEPIKLKAGESLTFTVFLRPNTTTNLDSLTVSISEFGIESEYKNRKMKGLDIVATKKNVFTNMKLPKISTAVTVDYSNWLSQLDDKTLIKGISLPGAGGAFTKGYTGNTPDNFKQQDLSFDELWQTGIRAFEISCDRLRDKWLIFYTEPTGVDDAITLADADVKCNKTTVNTTVGTVFNNLLTKVATVNTTTKVPEETAVLIITYQPESSTAAGGSRNATHFAYNLRKMYNNLTDAQKAQLILYKPGLTLEEARGKLIVICRINQHDEDDNGSFDAAKDVMKGTNILLIDGCGTAKDRWGARGYKITANGEEKRAYDISNAYSDAYYIEQYMNGRYLYTTNNNNKYSDVWLNADSTVTVKRAAQDTEDDLNFGFNTSEDGIVCWYQDWSRVVKTPSIYNNSHYWFESYQEKVSNVKTTFKMSIGGKKSDHVYINSLCGYLTIDDYTSSITPSTGNTYGGAGGDIKGLATELNKDFYEFVLQTPITGPTGIIMMDYVSNNSEEGGGAYYLPKVIIGNNFKSGSSNDGEEDPNTPPTDPETPEGGDQGGVEG